MDTMDIESVDVVCVVNVRSNTCNKKGGDVEVPGVPEGPVVRHNVIADPT